MIQKHQIILFKLSPDRLYITQLRFTKAPLMLEAHNVEKDINEQAQAAKQDAIIRNGPKETAWRDAKSEINNDGFSVVYQNK